MLAVSENISAKEVKKLLRQLEKEMMEAVKKLEFEKAALLRDQISFLQGGGGPIQKATKCGYTSNRKFKKYGKRK